MNKIETSKLLALASLVDNRTITPETVSMWHSILYDITFEEASDAMTEHFRTNPAYLMPVHLRTIVSEAEFEARRAPGREIAARRHALLEQGIDWIKFEAGDPDAVAAAKVAGVVVGEVEQ